MNKIKNRFNIMEVCGTHTMAIARYGLKKLFPKEINILSGPGCPICVTSTIDIDKAVELSKNKNVIITTFGDMLHVPGSESSLEKERSKGAAVRIVYSPVDALDTAEANPSSSVIFMGVGFETTSPVIAATVLIAKKRKIKNFFVLPMFKTIPNVLRTLLNIKERKIDGFILPGHVSAIIGADPYAFIADEFKVPAVIAGFEADDILKSVEMLVKQIEKNEPKIEIQYSRLVKEKGNKNAQDILAKVFAMTDSSWRGIGNIPESGLVFSEEFDEFNALKHFEIKTKLSKEPRFCQCGKILLGLKTPKQCSLFGSKCSPANPVGPCMVSSEGSCAAEYKYGYNV